MVLITGVFLLFICLEVENNEDSQSLYCMTGQITMGRA